MHGDKKWIQTYDGRIKRSRNRTRIDWLGDLNRRYHVLREEEDTCPECKAFREEHGRIFECGYHRELDELSWIYKYGLYHRLGAPSGFRRSLNRCQRAKVKNAIRRAEQLEGYEHYDALPVEKRNAAWLYL